MLRIKFIHAISLSEIDANRARFTESCSLGVFMNLFPKVVKDYAHNE